MSAQILNTRPSSKAMSSPGEIVNSRAAMLATLVTLLFLAITCFAFTPHYETNDDITMAMVASGNGASLAPDEHLLFMNIITGLLLKTLYTASPAIPWYALFLFVAHAVAIGVISHVFISGSKAIDGVVTALLFLAGVELYFVVNLQFTTTAFVVAAAGFILFFSAVDQEFPSKSIKRSSFGLFLLFLSCLIRRESLFLVSCLGSLLLVCKFMFTAGGLRKTVTSALLLLMPISLALAVDRFNGDCYAHSPGWEEFYPTTWAIANFGDYGRAVYSQETKPLFDNIGWSENDFTMMNCWFFSDRDRFPLSKMQKMLVAMPKYRSDFSFDFLKTTLLGILADKSFQSSLLTLLLAFLLLDTRRLSLWRALALLGCTIAIAGGLLVFAKLPARVYLPMAGFLAIAMLLFRKPSLLPARPMRINQLTPAAALAIVVAVSIVALEWTNNHRICKQVLRRNALLRSALTQLHPKHDQIFIVWLDTLPYECILPFEDLRDYFRNFKVIDINVMTGTPLMHDKLQRYGLPNLFTSITDSNVRLVSNDFLNKYLSTYLTEHYGMRVKFIKLYSNVQLSPDFNVYSLEVASSTAVSSATVGIP